MPELALEVLRKERDVKYHETLFALLSKEYEGTKIDEAYSAPMELIDKAVFPDEKSWPPKRWFAIGGFLAGGLGALVFVLFRELELRQKIRAVLNDAS